MEEENLVKKSDESINKNDYLKLKRSNEKKKAIIVVLIFTMILMLALILLYYFNSNNNESEKDNCPVCQSCEKCNCNEENEEEQDVDEDEDETIAESATGKVKMKKIKLSKNDQNVVVGGKTLKIKVVNKDLFVNDVTVYKFETNDISNGTYSMFVSEKLSYGIIAQEYESMCGSEPNFEGAISLNGSFAKIEYKAKDSTACLDEVYNNDGKYYAHYSGDFDNYNMEIIVK